MQVFEAIASQQNRDLHKTLKKEAHSHVLAFVLSILMFLLSYL